MEIQEIIRRWQAGEGYRRIASGTGLSRNTVRKYLSAAKAEGIARDGADPSDDQLSRLAVIGQPGPRQAETPSEDLLAPWTDQIYQWLSGDRLQLTRVHELLLGRGCQVCQWRREVGPLGQRNGVPSARWPGGRWPMEWPLFREPERTASV